MKPLRLVPLVSIAAVLVAGPADMFLLSPHARAQDNADGTGEDFSLEADQEVNDGFGPARGANAIGESANTPTGDMNLGKEPSAGGANATIGGGGNAVPTNAFPENTPRNGPANSNLARNGAAGGNTSTIPNEAVPGLEGATEGAAAERQNITPANPKNAVVGEEPPGGLPDEAYPFATGEPKEKPFRPENVPPPPEPERPRRESNAAASNDGSLPDEAAPNVDPSRSGAPGGENVTIPPSNGDAGSLMYAGVGTGRGAMSEAEMATFREIAGKLKALPLGTGPEKYTVQPGDTLWDISDQLLDDPFWWPRLWTLNEAQVRNPNLIYPSMELVFHPSDGEAAPEVAVKDTEEFLKPVALDRSDGLGGGNPLAATWKGKDGHLLDPSELPRDPSVFSVGDFNPSARYVFRIPGFMTNSDVDDLGRVRKMASSHTTAILGTLGYGDFKRAPKVGERFLVVREMTPEQRDPEGAISGVPMWTYVATVGVVHLNKSGIASLLVEEGPLGVNEGDLIVPFRNLYVSVNPIEDSSKSNTRSRVVGVLDDYALLASEAQAVFLEKKGPEKVGEEVDLFMPPSGSVFFGDDDDELDYVKVARARIVEVGDETVTAVVLQNTREVSVGARTYARE